MRVIRVTTLNRKAQRMRNPKTQTQQPQRVAHLRSLQIALRNILASPTNRPARSSQVASGHICPYLFSALTSNPDLVAHSKRGRGHSRNWQPFQERALATLVCSSKPFGSLASSKWTDIANRLTEVCKNSSFPYQFTADQCRRRFETMYKKHKVWLFS